VACDSFHFQPADVQELTALASFCRRCSAFSEGATPTVTFSRTAAYYYYYYYYYYVVVVVVVESSPILNTR
jgi:hypothetical protein